MNPNYSDHQYYAGNNSRKLPKPTSSGTLGSNTAEQPAFQQQYNNYSINNYGSQQYPQQPYQNSYYNYQQVNGYQNYDTRNHMYYQQQHQNVQQYQVNNINGSLNYNQGLDNSAMYVNGTHNIPNPNTGYKPVESYVDVNKDGYLLSIENQEKSSGNPTTDQEENPTKRKSSNGPVLESKRAKHEMADQNILPSNNNYEETCPKDESNDKRITDEESEESLSDNESDTNKIENTGSLNKDEDSTLLSENGSNNVVPVHGTSITLVTEEEIAKWREERKMMWLLKISNNKRQHMDKMGIKEDELKERKNVLHEAKKQKQFIQNIQNQLTRFNPKVNLNVKILQREMAKENEKLLKFIQELGDANLLDYELNDEEKEKLFGGNDNESTRRGNGFNQRNKSRNFNRNNNTVSRYNQKRETNKEPSIP
ncbi:hypothetical protein Kpol_1002p58 [Vanderwaltozyma polyspora DSM 70294]|uniref:FMR1-interacting protein 1 conserved domain-containing protein n=1 Tax=Vanderwaltozyma polyspora (strain ATCC 22028 / DSM 70294 / BCRC 21397 / CBS 2163 / NBRC 10782 / NRRL Y-8283 / UCD 57-17) TaxID=436907 RepID=A7TE89_VANPO|nr:uncharacterized protein Kpol_1002p58 [Vanderwaltozyma polyspora DSM 70294]EDO19411.1 hypothetical protein Kpol_1002p58 [Vanderwaltozyma polyspora DSM 70294]